MKAAYRVADVRAAEAALIAQLPTGTLMQRAAYGLAAQCVDLLEQERGRIVGARVVLLVGTGDNGGDALWAGQLLRARGVAVTALTLGSRWHEPAMQALLTAGGRHRMAADAQAAQSLDEADLVLDAIVGIGGSGALRPPADELARRANRSSALVVAVDLPSGLDADSGAVADLRGVVDADVTVTFGCLKPGLVLSPGAMYVGKLRLVDIGLEPQLRATPELTVAEPADAAKLLRLPVATDNKYSRGVVGVVAGSKPYPGAAVLCSGSARLGGVGMVRYAGGAPAEVIARWPEVVVEHGSVAAAGRVQAWVVGPGGGTDAQAQQRLRDALELDVPVVVDADSLTLLAEHDRLRQLVIDRGQAGRVTVLTPHDGEFVRLGFGLPTGADANRAAAVRTAASSLNAVVLLKGADTVVADDLGAVRVNRLSDSSLATAGSGDVLSGLLGSMLAAATARSSGMTCGQAADVAVCAALVHGLAGKMAAAGREPITAQDVLAALPSAVAQVRGIDLRDSPWQRSLGNDQ